MSPNTPVQDLNFHEVKESARADKRGRLTLGAEAKFKTYKVMVNRTGQILLDPVVNIPERELWLWQNDSARDSLRRGLEQAESGELHDLGSFAEDVALEIDD